MNAADINNMIDWLHAHDNIMICAHVSPDGDTLGSSLALSNVLRALGKRVCVACQDTPPYLYSFISELATVCKPDALPFTPDAALYCDCSDIGRVGTCANVHCAATAVIDHHVTNEGYCDTCLIDSTASATGVMIVELLAALNVPLTHAMAEQLYMAITTDTGNFSYDSTDGRTLRAAAKCADAGIDIETITRKLFRVRTVGRVRLLGYALNAMRIEAEGRIAMLPITTEMIERSGATEADTEGVVNYGIETEGVVLTAMLRPRGEDIKVSIRAMKPYNAASVALQFGGGGHDLAAGCTLHGALDEAMSAMLAALREELRDKTDKE